MTQLHISRVQLRSWIHACAFVACVVLPTQRVTAQDSTRGFGRSAAADTGLRVSRYYALLIGEEKYIDAGFGKLSMPVKDAQKLRDILSKRYRFEAGDIKVLKNARKSEILDELQRYSQVLGRNDNLLIFFAGHGGYDESRDEGFWMPIDARPLVRTSQLSNTELVQAIRAINTRHTLLIADVCFGGALRGDLTTGAERLYALPSRKIMSSGAKQVVPDNSVFLRLLLRQLESNKEEYLRAVELFADIQLAVAQNSPVAPQYKPILDVGDEGGEFLFPLSTVAKKGGRAAYVDDFARANAVTRGADLEGLTEPMDVVQAMNREFVQYVNSKELESLNPLTYVPKPGGRETWKENFITLVKDYLISATLAARPELRLEGERSSQSEVAITVHYNDQVGRGTQHRTIRFMLFHNLIGSTWSLTSVQILDKPPG